MLAVIRPAYARNARLNSGPALFAGAIRHTIGIKDLMLPRLDYARNLGCDAVEPDNVDWCVSFYPVYTW